MSEKQRDENDSTMEDPTLEDPAMEAPSMEDPTLEDLFGVDFDTTDNNAQVANAEFSQLKNDLAEMTDQAIRTQAELENYRKRVTRQMQEERRYANVSLIRDLLPAWDNMVRAILAAEKSDESPGLLEGFRMVVQQLEDILERHHCTPIEALEQPFDPHFHEAVSQMPSDEHPAGTVLLVTETGFQLHDRVIRPSKVIVSIASPETNLEEEPLD